MKITLTQKEIEDQVAFGVEFLEEVTPPPGHKWACKLLMYGERIVAECELVEDPNRAKTSDIRLAHDDVPRVTGKK